VNAPPATWRGDVTVSIDPEKIDAIFAPLDQSHRPGGVVGIAVNGKPVYRKGFGLADMDAQQVLTPSTRLRVGSVSKQFTCLAYMLLCEEGKARADDPLELYLPELHRVTHGVTIRQLMTHTSGLRDVYNIFCRFNDSRAHYAGPAQRVTSADLLELYRDIDDVEDAPGSVWTYNNGCYLLLSAVIERITGERLESTLADRVFGPIGMHDTLLLRSDTQFIGNRGSQHVVSPTGGFERMYWGVDNYLGGGAALSTVDDLLRWLAHMDRPTVGRAETWREMRAAHKLANGAETGYGLGLSIDRYRGVETLSHAGGAFGGGAQVLKVPAVGLDIAILINRQDAYGPAFTRRILDTCLQGLETVPRPETFPPASGTFRSHTCGRVMQLFARDGRQLVSIDGLDLPFERVSGGELRSEGWTLRLIGSRSNPQALHFDRGGSIDELIRIESVDSLPGDLILGRYHSAALDTRAAICAESRELLLRTRGRFGSVTYRLAPLAVGIWRAQCVDVFRGVGVPAGVLTFTTDHMSFRFSSGTTSRLRFDRCP
jgi:D-aminopeptidase